MRNLTRTPDGALAVLRVVVGGVFVAHGLQKLLVFGLGGLAGFMAQQGIPLPYPSAVAVTAAELLGGLALTAGLFTRLAALPLAFSMLVALVAVHLKGGFFLPSGVEYTLVLFAASLAFALAGPGAWSVDGLLARRRAVREIEHPARIPVHA
jgi:putative oxidoreductase